MKNIYLLIAAGFFCLFTNAQCLVAYYPFTGNTADSSGLGNNGNNVGATLTSDRFGNLNSAYEFTSNIDYIQVSNSTSLQLDSAFTISVWVKPTNTYGTSPNYHAIVGKWGGTADASYLVCLTIGGNPRFVTHDGVTNTELIGNSPIPLNQWTNIMVTQSHDTASIYLNGVLDTTRTGMNIPAIYNNDLLIGANNTAVNWDSFEGAIDEIRINNCDITHIPTGQCLVANYSFTGNTADSSGMGNNGNAIGATLTSDRFGNTNSAYEFTSNIDYIQVPNSPSLQLSTAYTISVWVKPLTTFGTGPNYHAIIGKWGGTGDASYLVSLTTSGNPRLTTHDDSTNTELIGRSPIPMNQWTNIMVTQSHDTASIYVNGILDTMRTGMFTPAIYTNQLLIGANNPTVNWDSFEGIIDDIQIYNCDITQDVISEEENNLMPELFPNPTSGTIHVNNFYRGTISVFSTLGKKIIEKTDEATIDLSELANGLYFIMITNGTKVSYARVIKTN